MIFCVDTSAWLDGWVRDYPPDVFPSLWEKLAERVADGVLKCSEEVYVELQKKDDGLHDWLKVRKEVLVPIDEEIQAIVSELLKLYPRLVDTFRNRSQADPFVIATAERLQAVVVTGEKPRGKLDIPKIPDVCEARKIRCITFLEMLRELEWKF
jgi:hypothetical protein